MQHTTDRAQDALATILLLFVVALIYPTCSSDTVWLMTMQLELLNTDYVYTQKGRHLVMEVWLIDWSCMHAMMCAPVNSFIWSLSVIVRYYIVGITFWTARNKRLHVSSTKKPQYCIFKYVLQRGIWKQCTWRKWLTYNIVAVSL